MAIKGYPYGMARLLLWEYVQTGTYAGMCSGQQSSLSAGSASGVYVWDDVKSAAIQEIAETELQITGGDKVKATITFPGGKLAKFDVQGSSIDTVLNDMANGGTTNTTNSKVTVTSNNPNRTKPRTMGVALQQGFRTSDGLDYAITRMIPRAQVRVRPGPMNYRGESDSILSISSIKTNKAFNGQSYGSGGLALNLEQDLTDYLDYITPNPFHIMAFKQNTGVTTFNTTYKPLSTVVTLNATENPFSIGGTPTALSAITLAGLVTLSAEGTVNVMDVLAYETDYVPAA